MGVLYRPLVSSPAAPPAAHPYSTLTPEAVLDAVASAGLRPDGRLLGLNSYENRVYLVYLEEGAPVVAKFYRPGRWSDAQILEEHAFACELASREIPVVAPLPFGGTTLLRSPAFSFAVYPKRGGRPPNLEDPKVLEWIGRFLGRIHAVGAT
jgi:Ser/Thr protein kinase RdoA (MazF antagonist)